MTSGILSVPVLVAVLAVACRGGSTATADELTAEGVLGPMPVPPGNPQTPEKVELGKLLFFDPRLSGGKKLSCSTCHLPSSTVAGPRPLRSRRPSCPDGAAAARPLAVLRQGRLRHLPLGPAVHRQPVPQPRRPRGRAPARRPNGALTAPYMHNGVFATLEAVVAFYEGGGEARGRSPLVRPFTLTIDERAAIVAYLDALTHEGVKLTPPDLP